MKSLIFKDFAHCCKDSNSSCLMVFSYFVNESLGAWHKSAISEVKKLGSAKARQNGEKESVEISRLFQKLSVALMRGNCALFNNRVPSTEAGLTLWITSTKCTCSECNARLHQTNPSIMCTYVINIHTLSISLAIPSVFLLFHSPLHCDQGILSPCRLEVTLRLTCRLFAMSFSPSSNIPDCTLDTMDVSDRFILLVEKLLIWKHVLAHFYQHCDSIVYRSKQRI